jgi:hypothetical protein
LDAEIMSSEGEKEVAKHKKRKRKDQLSEGEEDSVDGSDSSDDEGDTGAQIWLTYFKIFIHA